MVWKAQLGNGLRSVVYLTQLIKYAFKHSVIHLFFLQEFSPPQKRSSKVNVVTDTWLAVIEMARLHNHVTSCLFIFLFLEEMAIDVKQ